MAVEAHERTAAAGPALQQSWQRAYVRRLILSDLLAISVSVLVAELLRFGFEARTINGVSYAGISILLCPVWLLVLAANRCYEPRFLGNGLAEYKRVFSACGRLAATIAIVSYSFKFELARGFVALAIPLGTLLILVGRYGARSRLRARRRAGECRHRVLVVGDPQHAYDLIGELQREPAAGFEVVGLCLTSAGTADGTLSHIPVVGGLGEVVSASRQLQVDTVAITSSPVITSNTLRSLAWSLEGSGVDMVVAPALTDWAGPRISIRPVAGLPLLHLEEPQFEGVPKVLKQCQDWILAALLLLLVSPLLLVVTLSIRLTSRGPALFRQQRVGRNGEPFVVYKFRTMHVDAESMIHELRAHNDADEGGALFKMRRDPRVTRLGRYLRRYSIDELPQLWNVLKGDMALVGPRPPLPSEVALYGLDVRRRLLVRPGITGLWQVSGRSDLDWDTSVRLDLHYVENWSFYMDLQILAKTVLAVLRARGAY